MISLPAKLAMSFLESVVHVIVTTTFCCNYSSYESEGIDILNFTVLLFVMFISFTFVLDVFIFSLFCWHVLEVYMFLAVYIGFWKIEVLGSKQNQYLLVVNFHLIPVTGSLIVCFMTKSTANRNKKSDIMHPCCIPAFTSVRRIYTSRPSYIICDVAEFCQHGLGNFR